MWTTRIPPPAAFGPDVHWEGDPPAALGILPSYVQMVKKWPQIGLKVHLFSAGVSETEVSAAMDASDTPQATE